MTVGLDTSVVVRLLSGEPPDLAELALRELRAWTRRGERVLVSEWVLAESYYALQHHYGASKKDTLAALRSFLATPGVETSAEAIEVLTTPALESAKPGFVDRLLYRGYLRSGADEVATFERAASKLPRARVLG